MAVDYTARQMQQNYTIRLLPWSEAQLSARAVRDSVFIQEQGIPEAMEWDAWDAVSVHAVAVSFSGLPIATGRILPADEKGAIRLGRMAVEKHWRRSGVGSAVLRALLAEARMPLVREIVLHAQIAVTGLYRKHGFKDCGGIFLEAGIPHVEMRLDCRDECS